MTVVDEMERALGAMSPVELEAMKAVRLMNRMDRKYMAAAELLPELLGRIAADYHVQRIGGEALADYHTLYFDTAGLEMYTQHHNQKLTRQKVRVRCYRSSMTTFFEIKNKDNKKKTRKIRVPLAAELFDTPFADAEALRFVRENTPYGAGGLLEQVENWFRRITLVDKGFNERVTIDTGIRFHNRHTGGDCALPRLAIVEVKHETGAPPSPIELALREMRIHAARVSKYCIGTVLTNGDAKANRFKEKIRYIENL